MLCIMGSLLVPLLSVWFSGQKNTKLVNYGLSLSAGSMFTTALYMMLPDITHENRFSVITGIISGITVSLLLNYIVHAYTSESLIHCAHGDEGHSAEHSSSGSNTNVDELVADENETAPLLSTSSHNHQLIYKKSSGHLGKSLIDLINHYRHHNTGKCCSLYECTPTFEPSGEELINEINNNLPLTSAQITTYTKRTSCSEDRDNDKNKLILTRSRALSIVCVENTIGYDLENLSIYRKHFYSDKEQSISLQTELINNDENGRVDNSAEDPGTINGTSVDSNLVEYNPLTISKSNQSLESRDSLEHTTGCENLNIDTNEVAEQNDKTVSKNHDLNKHLVDTSSAPQMKRSSTHPHSICTQAGSLSKTLSHSSHDIHHHHMETPFSKLLSIGMQTCIVLTLHKFPEGFIIYYTNQDETPDSLGFSIFISLAIHNFVEGFAMTLPLYAVFEYKWMAILITAILGGGSQPLGALIGYLMFKNKTPQDGNELQMDFFLSLTAGFLLIIGLQMFQTAVGFSDSHHHHQGEDNELMKSNHSSGTTCLKWCCLGVVLVLSSEIFV